MSYLDAFSALAARGDFDGALELLRAIFHDPDHQAQKGRPSDYQRTPSEREQTTLGAGFDGIVAGFKPRTTIAEKVHFVVERLGDNATPEQLRAHRAQPINALRFEVSDYERGNVVVDTLHLDAAGNARNQGLVLNHEIVFDDDSREDYDFTYDLVHGGKYTVVYQGEKLAGELVHFHLKLVLFARYLRGLVDELIASEVFARLPKALPFRFEIGEHTGYGGDRRAKLRFPVRPPLDEVALAGHPLAAIYRDVAAEVGQITPEDRYLSLLALADKAEHRFFASRGDVERQTSELGELLRQHADLRARFVALVHRHLDRVTARLEGRDPPEPMGDEDESLRGSTPTFAALLWQNADLDEAAAVAYTRRALALPVPALDEDDIDDRLTTSAAYLETVFRVWQSVPLGARAALEADWTTMLDRLGRIEVPEFRVQLLEQIAHVDRAPDDDSVDDEIDDDEIDDDEFDNDSDDNKTNGASIDIERDAAVEQDGLHDPPPGYVEALVALVDRMPETFSGWATNFPFVVGRLRRLGPAAAAAIPGVLRKIDQYAKIYDGDRTCAELSRVLIALGHDEVPAEVHRLAAAPYDHCFKPFYPAWSRRVPERKVSAMLAAAAASPEDTRTPAFWERMLHDSPAGIDLAAAAVAADAGLTTAAEDAARAGAGPLLARLIAHRIKAVHAAKQFVELERLLELLPSLSDEQATMLYRVRCKLALVAHVARSTEAAPRIAALVEREGARPYPAFLASLAAVDRDGPAAALAPTRSALARIAASDPVLAKAAVVYTDTPSEQIADISDDALYGVFRIAQRADEETRQRAKDLRGFEDDPIADALETIGKGSPTQWTSAWRAFVGERALIERTRGLGPDELLDHLDATDFERSLHIARRVLATPTPARVGRVLDMVGWFVGERDATAERRKTLYELVWPLDDYRDQILQHPAWIATLDRFIIEYRGPSIEHAKTCFTRLGALGRHDAILATVAKLPDEIVTGAYRSVIAAFHQRRDFAGAIALTTEMVRRLTPLQPDYVLMSSNLAVNQILGGDHASAEHTLDNLFAQDFSRFLAHEEPEEDEDMTEILGGSIDAPIVAAFKVYFAGAKYNAACLYALTDRPERAVAALRDAILHAPERYPADTLRAESDFASLGHHPAFLDLLAELDGEA